MNEIIKDNERCLLKQYKESGDEKALSSLLELHTPYIQKMANNLYLAFRKMIDVEDLIQEGKVGLIQAINKFDLNTDYTLLTYAHFKILAAMQSLYHRSFAVHIPAHLIRAIHYNIKNPNTDKDLVLQAMRSVSFGDLLDGDKKSSNQKKLFNPPCSKMLDTTFESATKHLYSPNVKTALAKLSKDERQILDMRLGLNDGLPCRIPYIAEEMNLPEKVVGKMFRKAKKTIERNLIAT